LKSNQAAFDSEEHSYRQLLQEELAKRCTGNSQYSLRAFARDLDTDHSTLSQILRGRRRLTERTIRKFGEILGLDAGELQKHVLREGRRGPLPANDQSVQVLRELTEDTVAVISGFEHYAILELTHLDDFRPDVSWVARMLGLDPDAVNVAIYRLLRLGLLEMVSPTEWIDCTGDVTNLLDGVAYEAVRRLSERARAHALESELTAPASEREFSSTTIAVDRRRLPEAMRILAAARSEILGVLAEGDRRDHVYQLDISLLPLTRHHPPRKERHTDE
jgi:transcriptional regulator with XRE-family HTH domain